MQVNSYTFQTPYSQPVQVGRPTPEMVQEQQAKAQEQLDKTEKNTTELLSKKDQAEISIKSSAMYQNDSTYTGSTSSVKAYTTLSQEVQRSQNINTYVSNESNF
jgi:hypothetical protein